MKKRVICFMTACMTMILFLLFGTCVHAASSYNISVSNKKSDSFVLEWDRQSGADAYRVLIYDSSEEEWVKYKTVISEKCTLSNLKPSTSYKVKIRSLKKDGGSYERISESGVFTVKTKQKAVSSIRKPSLPNPRNYGFKMSDKIPEHATYSGYAFVKDSDTAIDMVDKYRKALENKGFDVEIFDYSKDDDENALSAGYKLYYNGVYVGIYMEYFVVSGTDIFCSVTI